MPTVALVMIARNEARCIARCLNSVRTWVDRMVVLDTGSSDDTMAIARACGAEVHEAAWSDDFSAARNQALALGGCDWHLVLDADEWLISGGEALAALREQPPEFVGTLTVDSVFEQAIGPQSWSPSHQSRVLPGTVRYTGRIHEQPAHQLPVRHVPIVVGHDGYLPEPMARKGERNQRLLAQALRDTPDDDYLLYQLGKDHDVHGRYAAACDALLKALAFCPAQAPYRHDLVLRTLHALKQLNRLPEAIDLAQQEMPHWSHSADFHFTVGDVLLSHAVSLPPEEAQEVLPLIEACWLRCMELGDTLTLEGAVKGRGSHLAAHNLVVFYESLGLPERADPWRIVAASANTR